MRSLLLACVVLVARCPAAAAAQSPRDLWATVNVCDTAATPNTIGVRGSMPGLKRKATLRMRFRVQYLAPDGRWLHRAPQRRLGLAARSAYAAAAASSPAGASRSPRRVRRRSCCAASSTSSGAAPARSLRRARKITEDGHVSTAGADPPGFSAGTCRIS